MQKYNSHILEEWILPFLNCEIHKNYEMTGMNSYIRLYIIESSIISIKRQIIFLSF